MLQKNKLKKKQKKKNNNNNNNKKTSDKLTRPVYTRIRIATLQNIVAYDIRGIRTLVTPSTPPPPTVSTKSLIRQYDNNGSHMFKYLFSQT